MIVSSSPRSCSSPPRAALWGGGAGSDDGRDCVYNLTALLVHCGGDTKDAGHYLMYSKLPDGRCALSAPRPPKWWVRFHSAFPGLIQLRCELRCHGAVRSRRALCAAVYYTEFESPPGLSPMPKTRFKDLLLFFMPLLTSPCAQVGGAQRQGGRTL
jgi:hypothetical protein